MDLDEARTFLAGCDLDASIRAADVAGYPRPPFDEALWVVVTSVAEVASLHAVADVARRFVEAADSRSMAKPTAVYVEEFRAALDGEA